MPFDTIKIARLAQEFMAALEADEDFEGKVISEVAIVVECRGPDNSLDTPTGCTNDSRVYQTGLFKWALESVEWTGEPVDDPPSPED